MQRIIISAYGVSPIRGSECAVGWEITRRLGKNFDVTVLMCYETPSNNSYYSEITEFIAKNGEIENVKYIPIKMPTSSRFYSWLHDHGFWPAYYWGYKTWQKAAFKIAKKLHSHNPFNLAYQLNMIGFREPGYLWQLDIPFVWGPTNGFHSIPFSFIKSFSGKEFLFQSVKHIANEIQISLACRARKAAKKAGIVWCVDTTALNKMLQWYAKAELMQETGLNTPPSVHHLARYYDGKRCLNIVCSGMITSGKAYFILIDSLLQLKDKKFHLTFLGDGPLMKGLKKRSERISDKITWCGWVQRSETVKFVKQSDILIHTSLKEGTPHSILEAIGLGIPVVCHDTCGMGSVVNDKNGFKIPYINAGYSTRYLVDLLNSIMENPKILNEKYLSINECSDSLTWDTKVKIIASTITGIIND